MSNKLRSDTLATISRNLERLMREHGDLSARALEKRTKTFGEGVGAKTIRNIINQEKHPTSRTQEILAQALGVEVWELNLPHFSEDIGHTPSISKLYESYTAASPEGRRMIESIAEREAEYAKKANDG